MASQNFTKRKAKLDAIIAWNADKPKNDAAWAEDVKVESLNYKFDDQLVEMETSHEAKVPHVQKDLDKFNDFPDAIKFELNERAENRPNFDLEGKTKQEWIEEEFTEQHQYYQWKIAKLNQSVERIKKEINLRSRKKVSRMPL